MSALQWGGRFGAAARRATAGVWHVDRRGSRVSAVRRRVFARRTSRRCAGERSSSETEAAELASALAAVAVEIRDGGFANYARAQPFEDVHGAIDARVRGSPASQGNRCTRGAAATIKSQRRSCSMRRPRAGRRETRTRHRDGFGRASAGRAGARDGGRGLHAPAAGATGAARIFARCLERAIRARGLALCGAWRAWGARRLRSEAPRWPARAWRWTVKRRRARWASPGRRATRWTPSAIATSRWIWRTRSCARRSTRRASPRSHRLVGAGLRIRPVGRCRLDRLELMPQKRNPDPFELVRAHAARSIGAYAARWERSADSRPPISGICKRRRAQRSRLRKTGW